MPEIDQHTEQVTRHYDRLSANGPYGTLAPHNRGGRKSEYVAAVFDAALLGPLVNGGPHQVVLDFGCGTGIFTRKIAAIAREVVGMDVSAGMLVQAKSVCSGLDNVRLLRTDGRQTDLPDQYVDVIVVREVLCYVRDADLRDVLSELRRVAKPGGRLLWLEQSSNHPHWQRHPQAPHLVKRSPQEIRQAAEDSGWKVHSERIVRTPRFPWIYPVWLGMVPRRLIPTLARWEVDLHASAHGHRYPRRWWDALFELQKPADG
jgi:ubiquinone/menaquinone biosynthesis C-methylase UbiE